MNTIRDEIARAERKPKEKLQAGRQELLQKIDAHIVALVHAKRAGALHITFYTSLGRYRILNTLDRLSAFRDAVKASSGWTGKFREHADTIKSKWKNAGIRGTRPNDRLNSFALAVQVAEGTHKLRQEELQCLHRQMTMFKLHEQNAETAKITAINKQEETKKLILAKQLQMADARLALDNAETEAEQFKLFGESHEREPT